MKINLVLLNIFENEFKDNNYTIYQFVDPQSLTIINGSNLKGNFKIGEKYDCLLEIKNGKLKVSSIFN